MRSRLSPLVELAVLLSACGGPTQFLHPLADLAPIEKVAVLPFENMTTDRTAGEKVYALFMIELLAVGAFEVVEPGLVRKVLKDNRLESVAAMTPADMKKVAEALGANGLFAGTVVEFAEARAGNVTAPEVTVQLRLLESQTGATVWAASKTRSGAGLVARLFGFGGDSLVEATQQLLRSELHGLVVQ